MAIWHRVNSVPHPVRSRRIFFRSFKKFVGEVAAVPENDACFINLLRDKPFEFIKLNNIVIVMQQKKMIWGQ